MVGELKNPLLYKNIIMPIIGPIPNTKSTNFAEFFVWPNFWSFKLDLTWIFFDFFFFINGILLQLNLKKLWFAIEFEIIFQFNKINNAGKKDRNV
mgnify:CR=1 FL=1